MSAPPDERRFKRVFISLRDLPFLLNCGVRRSSPLAPAYVNLPVLPGLPKDAEVISVAMDSQRYALSVIVSHPSYDRVMDGCEIPALDGCEAVEYALFQRNDRGSYDLKL